MPNMSIQSLHIGLPCSNKLWDAKNASEWKDLITRDPKTPALLTLVKKFVASEDEMLSKPYDRLSFQLALHGLMSMCNDMLHFDNRSI